MEGGNADEPDNNNKKKLLPEPEIKSKRKMKTASQLEILEKTYAMETYPSEPLRAELSVKLGLSDRQLQMWFCHRRLKDRKGQQPAKRPKTGRDSPVTEGMAVGSEVASGSGSGTGVYGHGRVVAAGRTPGVAVPRISSGDVQAMKRYYEPPQSIVELRAITFVEAQLGEPLREDGPILGMEFDPLPPDAFGMPIGTIAEGHQKPLARHFEANLYERPDVKPVKAIQGATRALQEYQFLPQQPSVKAEMRERVAPSYQYGSPVDVHNVKTAILTSARPLVHADEQLSAGFGFPSPVPSLNLMPQEGRQGHVLPTAKGDYETVSHKNSYANAMDAQLNTHPITALEMSSDRRVVHEEDVLRMERKRKSEEARMAREVEAHEKRIRKELEKQDILRRKREEQMRKDMERLDRERRKEEERLLREKQREEERYLREQRREMERREKFMQKESIRAEKMRQKEELRREKEAARQKAASERAIARRMAKESMELVDDERLELMELAASSKGLPSIIPLDFETLQTLHLFRDKLTEFPPKSVLLKRPFAIQPWNLSEENVGNLLMTWRFLITFVDVLGIWPFTLDEFVQALHDYDPRLLGEIHIALLKIIIKDIEDVARTPATGLGTNQNSAVNPGGGHPEIVEGAYAWGFDIRSWHRHLNPLTWPEILRQIALSAGFGPQLKKRNTDQGYTRDENEGNDGEDVITNLRSGAAVENAVAIMQERGFSNPRRSRHRLTPGTVKYAAFHVLSLEGSSGLTILEVADRIQRSGLRDLSTSKTPEASISAALSRDTKLFERTAPSTYCVRPAYRKDPADAEAILSAARERIRAFTSGLVDGEDAEDAERDDDSESDATEDPEIDDGGSEVNLKKKDHDSPGANTDHISPGENKLNTETSLVNEIVRDEIIKTPQLGPKNTLEVLSSMHTGGDTEVNGVGPSVADVSGSCNILGPEGADIDESSPGEPWVHGLMEGEYSDLSVEERLNALVSLIGVVIEGNSIRVVLEERLEAANALKKQMWAEAQLDKRRMKEECVMRMHYPSYVVNKMEPNLALSAEGRQSPPVTVDEKTNEIPMATLQQERLSNAQVDINVENMDTEGNMHMQDLSAAPDNLIYQAPGHATEKSRSQLKSLIGHKAEEMYVYRSLPLGQDRRRNRYWQFITSASHNDPGCGRIFVELRDGCWRLIDSEEGFDALLSSLDVRGVRESRLHAMLQKIETSFKDAIRRRKLLSYGKREDGDIKEEVGEATGPADFDIADSPSSAVCSADSDASETSTSFTIELGKNQAEKTHMLNRYQDFENWMWRECSNSSVLCGMKYGKKRCKPLLGACDNCHDVFFLEDNQCPCQKPLETTGNNLNFQYMARCEEKLKTLTAGNLHGPASPLRIRLLKLLLALIEVSILPESLKPFWTKGFQKSWGMKLHSSSTAEELLELLTLLEGAIERACLSSNFETTSELLDSSNLSSNSSAEKVAVLPWLPTTTAAVALRVMEFDASISYILNQEVGSQKEKGDGEYIKLPSKYAAIKNTQNIERSKTPNRPAIFHEENRADRRAGLAGMSHARANRTKVRTQKSEKKATGSRSESGKRSSATKSDRLGQVLVWKGRSRAQVGHKQGRRSARSRQKAVKQTADVAAQTNIPGESVYKQSESTYKQSQMGLARELWNRNETKFQGEMAENVSSSERSEYDYENDQGSGDDYDDAAVKNYTIGFNGSKSGGFLEESDYNADANLCDDNALEEDEDEEQGDIDAREYAGYTIEDSELVGDGEEDQNEDPDDEMASSSSECSD